MLKYYTVIVGFATLVSAFYPLLKGASFYIAVILSFLLSVGTFVAWYQTDHLKRLRAITFPLLTSLLKNIGAEVVPTIVEIAKKPGMKKEVVDVFAGLLQVKPDPSERYWIYVVLGMIGDKKSIALINKGLSDENKLAQDGAKEAMQLMKNREKGEHIDETSEK